MFNWTQTGSASGSTTTVFHNLTPEKNSLCDVVFPNDPLTVHYKDTLSKILSQLKVTNLPGLYQTLSKESESTKM